LRGFGKVIRDDVSVVLYMLGEFLSRSAVILLNGSVEPPIITEFLNGPVGTLNLSDKAILKVFEEFLTSPKEFSKFSEGFITDGASILVTSKDGIFCRFEVSRSMKG